MIASEYEHTIEQIAAGLAHEVKNPISLVRANIDLLELNDKENENTENYKMMRRELERINDLLLDFIQFAKPLENNLTDVPLQSMLCEIIDILRTVYSKKIEFEINFRKSEVLIRADENKIRRVFVNLLKNAVEAVSDNGKISVDLHSKRGYRVVSITDNGKGISKMDLENILQPFYTTKNGGSGLGLYICKNIISEHGGLFSIDSMDGKGCTVTVSLPRFSKAACVN